MGKKKARSGKKEVSQSPDIGRRRIIWLGLGALTAVGTGAAGYKAGWFTSVSTPSTVGQKGSFAKLAPVSLPVDAQNALRAISEMTEYYARLLDNPSALIHAVRAFGKDFRRADGSRAVDFLCTRFASEREIGSKRYVYFPRDYEVHDNSFLKTFLEAGVSAEQLVTVGNNRYTLRDVAESAKSIFRCDPNNLTRFDPTFVHEHMPWGLIAFSILTPPTAPTWINAYGETINLPQIINSGLTEYESTYALAEPSLKRGEAEPSSFREAIKKYSCFGMHSIYGFLACLKHGYRENNLAERLWRLMNVVTYRLKSDAEAIEREYAAEGQGAPPIVVEALRQRALVKLYGHAFESINYVKLHRLFQFTPDQEQRIEAGERGLYESIIKLRSLDWGALERTVDRMLGKGQGEKFISDIVIALGHALRAMKLLTPDNPDESFV